MSDTFVVIWLHGLGATASDMEMVSTMLDLPDGQVKHVFLQAPDRAVTINQDMVMPAWYDIQALGINAREDEVSLIDSYGLIKAEIEKQIQCGFRPNRIVLCGFSQGGAMSLYTALQSSEPLRGVVSLSGYLPLSRNMASRIWPSPLLETPFLMTYGRFDPIIQANWVLDSKAFLNSKGFKDVSVEAFDREHTICEVELQILSNWLRNCFAKG